MARLLPYLVSTVISILSHCAKLLGPPGRFGLLACARAIAGISITAAISPINCLILICLSFPLEPSASICQSSQGHTLGSGQESRFEVISDLTGDAECRSTLLRA